MATAMSLNVNDNGFRASKLLVDGGSYIAKQLLLQKAIQGTITTLDEFFVDKPVRQTIKSLKRKSLIKGIQYDIIYPTNGNPTNLDEWDITLVTLILNNCLTLSPAEYIAVQDIRDLRNTLYGHTAKVEMTDAEFQQKWADIVSTLTKHVTLLTDQNSNALIQDMITRISKETLSADTTIHTLKEWYEWGMEVEQKLEEMIEDQRALVSRAETKSDYRHRDTTDQLVNIRETQKHIAKDVSTLLKVGKSEKRRTVQGTKLSRKSNQHGNTRKYVGNIADTVSLHLKRTKEVREETVDRHELNIKINQHGNTRKYVGNIADTVSLLLKRTKEVREETVDRHELNRKIKQAKLKLEAHTQDLDKFNIPCKTRMTETVTQQLQKNKIVVLKGIPGSGKSHLAKNVLNHFLTLNPDKAPLIISKASEIERILDPDGSFVLLVDDMIGKISFDATEYKNWIHYIDTFMSHVKVGQLYVVLTIRTAIFRQCQKEVMSDMFATENVIETDNYLLPNEKRDIFELYRKYHGVEISSDQSDNIVQKQNFGIGFPLLCRMMKGHNVEEMFSCPTDYIKAEISPHASQDPLVFVILFMTLIGDNSLSKNELELTQNQKACFKTLQGYFKTSKIDMHMFYQKADMIEETFLSYDKKNNHFSFIHEAVAHSIFEVALEIQPGVLIERCPFDSLIRNMNLITDTSHTSTCIELRPTNPYVLYRQHIIDRMIHVMSNDDTSNIKNVTSASIWKNKAFVEETIFKFDTRQLYFKDEKGLSLLVHFAGFGRKYALKCVIARLANDDETHLVNQLQLALESACSSGENVCVDYLLTKVADIDSQVVIAAVTGGNLEIVDKITVNYGFDKIETIREKNTDRTLLHIAAERGSGDLVTYLHHRCPSLRDKIDRNGCNAIHLSSKCVTKGAIECLKLFIDMGISPILKNNNGESILSQAVQYGNIDTVKYICELYPELLHSKDNDGNNALHNAARNGTVLCMKFLVEKGLNPIEMNENANTILHSAASGGNIATLKYICDTYPDLLPVTDDDSLNALHHAVYRGTVKCVKFLIDKGIDPREKTDDEQTVLHWSAFGGNIATLTYICDTYPDLLPVTDDAGLNALHHTVYGDTVECVELLIDKGIDPRSRTSDEKTILHCSADGGNIAMLKYIYETYPELLLAIDDEGLNALNYAAQCGTVECVKFLIEKGIDPEKRTSNGKTILHSSAIGGNIATLKYLFETYPDMLPVTDVECYNALHHIAYRGSVECVKFLIDKGIDPGSRTCDDKTILHCSAEGANIVTLEYIYETYPDMLPATDELGFNALHHAAFKGAVECVMFLINKGIDPADRTSDGKTILHWSAICGNMDTLEYIYEKYPDLFHEIDNSCLNAFHYAALNGTVECVKFLIDKGIDPGNQTSNGRTILHYSAIGGNMATLKYICENCSDLLQAVDNDGLNAIHHAAHRGTVECVKFLIDKGIDPANRNSDGKTILHLSAIGGNLATLEYIYEKYPDMFNAIDELGLNALHHAAFKGAVKCVTFLIDKGIDPADRTSDGKTILHWSAIGGNMDTLEYIYEKYPDLFHEIDNSCLNAFHYAALNGTVECVKFLIDKGIDPGNQTSNGRTIVHYSAIGGNMATLKYICEKCSDFLQAVDNDGLNALHHAAHRGTVECVKFLIDKGINPANRDSDGKTILHLSAIGGNLATLEYIYEKYPDMFNAIDELRLNALHHAAFEGAVDCVTFLIDKGIDPAYQTSDGKTILHWSVICRNLATLEYIYEKYPDLFHAIDELGLNTLHHAAFKGSVECLDFLIDKGMDQGERTGDGKTILHWSAIGGNIATLKDICDNYSELLPAIDDGGLQALHIAAFKGTVECLDFLIDKGIAPGDRTGDGKTILHWSAIGGNIATMAYICEKYPDLLNSIDDGGLHALHHAACKGTVECLDVLIDKGIDPSDRTSDGKTILQWSAIGGNIATLEYIYEKYPDLFHAKDDDGFNALDHAALKGTFECVTFLIDKSIYPDDRISDGKTVLHWPVICRNMATLVYIDEKCPDMFHAIDDFGLNALHYAAFKGTVECLEFLIDKGNCPVEKTVQGSNILHWSAIGGNIPTLDYICYTYPDVLTVTDTAGLNALHNAAQHGTVECMKFLIDKGIEPEDQTSSGKTILHCSVIGENLATLEYIYETYPDLLFAIDDCGFNTLHFAAQSGNVECLQFLIDKGIEPGDRTSSGKTILHCSVIGENLATLEYIYETYPDLLFAIDDCGFNALHHACKGTVELVKFLVNMGINPMDKDHCELTVLHCSAKAGNIATLTYICETYSDLLHTVDNDGLNALHHAAHRGTVECVKFLIDKGICQADSTYDDNTRLEGSVDLPHGEQNILHWSAFGGNIATLKYIYEKYPDMLPAIDDGGFNTLHYAAQSGNVECLQFLIDKGIDPADRTSNGKTILHFSAIGGNIAMLENIYENYPELLPVIDNCGLNALHHAAHAGTVACVKFLIEKGNCPLDRTFEMKNILQLSAIGGNIATLEYIHEKYPELLPAIDDCGLNALHHAAHAGTVECVKFLIDKGIDPRGRTFDEQTVLHVSVIGGNIATLNHICETYPDLLRLTDKCCRNALHLASVDEADIACLDLLLDQNIDPEAVNDDGKNILHIAIMNANAEIIQFIITKRNHLLNTVNISIIHDLLNTAIETDDTEMTQLCLNVIAIKNENPLPAVN